MSKRIDREGPIHKACLEYLRRRYPRGVVWHTPNSLDMGGDKAKKARAQNKAKGLGMLPGFPDLCVLTPGLPLMGIEVKAPGNYATDAQKAVGEAIRAAGGRWAVVRGLPELAEKLAIWEAESVTCSASVPLVGVVR